MSQGPLISLPKIVSTTLPELLRTRRQPGPDVAKVPSVVGRLPTMTHPDRSTTNAVVKPTPPGQEPGNEFGSICANNFVSPSPGDTCTMVVPVPCKLPVPCEFGALLKLLTRI